MTSVKNKRILYIGGVAETVDSEVLQNTVSVFGEVLTVSMPKDPGTNKHRGFAFVEFELEEDASAAMDNLDGMEMAGRTLKVNVSTEGLPGGNESSSSSMAIVQESVA